MAKPEPAHPRRSCDQARWILPAMTPSGRALTADIFLERELGRGNVGVVWLARHARLGQYVAVKLLDSRAHASEEARIRFDREATASALITSRHVVRVLEVGRLPDGQAYLVMELLRGRDLKTQLSAVGTLSLPQTVTLVQQICEVLEQSHRVGVIHRDLKPANIFLVEGPELFVKVLDFGVAKLQSDHGLALTATDALIGTPYYMSPEQFVHPRGVDQRADLWATAVLAYACLTGKLPFLGETVGALALAVHRPFAPPSTLVGSLPSSLDAWFLRALASAREGRFQSAGELAQSFLEASAGPSHGATAKPPAPITFVKPRPRRRWWLGAAAVLVLSGLAGAALLGHHRRWLFWGSAVVKGKPPAKASCDGLRSRDTFDPEADRQSLGACDEVCASGDAGACLVVGRAFSEARAGRDDVRALTALRKACEANEPRGCTKAGVLLARGRGAPKDNAAAATLYQRGCDGADLDGCANLARAHANGLGVARDPATAIAIASRACDAGGMLACSMLGLHYANGQGVAPDPARAAMLFKRACDGGAAIGCANLAIAHEQGRGVPQDHRLAAELGKRACAAEDVHACAVQRDLVQGDRSAAADARALALFSSSCELGDARACRYLGWKYAAGEGVPDDGKRAGELYQKACDGEDIEACVNLAQLYSEGRGLAQDLARAAALFQRACDQASAAGCENLAQAYQAGRGVPADVSRAAALYDQACVLNAPIACANLGVFYGQGLGVPKNETRANELWTKGCRLGAPMACESAAYGQLMGIGVAKDEVLAAKAFANACERNFLKSCAWLGHLYKAGRGVPLDAARSAAFYKKACSGGDADACAETQQNR